MTEEPIDIDPLFVGMTRPPMAMGVPMEFFGINFVVFGVGMILLPSLTGKALFFCIISLPLHGLGTLASEKEPRWMRLWLTKLARCPGVRNRLLWKSNSYMA